LHLVVGVHELPEPLAALQQVVLGELVGRPRLVEDCLRLGREVGVDVEQPLEGLLAGQLLVQLIEQRPTLGQRLLQFGLLLGGLVCFQVEYLSLF